MLGQSSVSIERVPRPPAPSPKQVKKLLSKSVRSCWWPWACVLYHYLRPIDRMPLCWQHSFKRFSREHSRQMPSLINSKDTGIIIYNINLGILNNIVLVDWVFSLSQNQLHSWRASWKNWNKFTKLSMSHAVRSSLNNSLFNYTVSFKSFFSTLIYFYPHLVLDPTF